MDFNYFKHAEILLFSVSVQKYFLKMNVRCHLIPSCNTEDKGYIPSRVWVDIKTKTTAWGQQHQQQ
jgi:hypothetical protein